MLVDLEKRALAQTRVPLLGRIKLGEQENGAPRDREHFVVPDALHPILGSKPKRLEIILPFAQLESNFDTERSAWFKNRALRCSSRDGVTARFFNEDPKRGELGYMDIKCPGDACPVAMAGQCRARGKFRFQLLEVLRQRPETSQGIWELTTSDRRALEHIIFTLKAIGPWIAQRADGYAGLPFVLERLPVKRTVLKPGETKPTMVTKHPLQMTLHPVFQRHVNERLVAAALTETNEPLKLAHAEP